MSVKEDLDKRLNLITEKQNEIRKIKKIRKKKIEELFLPFNKYTPFFMDGIKLSKGYKEYLLSKLDLKERKKRKRKLKELNCFYLGFMETGDTPHIYIAMDNPNKKSGNLEYLDGSESLFDYIFKLFSLISENLLEYLDSKVDQKLNCLTKKLDYLNSTDSIK